MLQRPTIPYMHLKLQETSTSFHVMQSILNNTHYQAVEISIFVQPTLWIFKTQAHLFAKSVMQILSALVNRLQRALPQLMMCNLFLCRQSATTNRCLYNIRLQKKRKIWFTVRVQGLRAYLMQKLLCRWPNFLPRGGLSQENKPMHKVHSDQILVVLRRRHWVVSNSLQKHTACSFNEFSITRKCWIYKAKLFRRLFF